MSSGVKDQLDFRARAMLHRSLAAAPAQATFISCRLWRTCFCTFTFVHASRRAETGPSEFARYPRSLGRELIDRAVVVRSAMNCRSEEVTQAIRNHPVVSEGAVRNALETVDNAFDPLPGGVTSYLEDRAKAHAAFTGRSVEIASGINDQVANRAVAIVSALETVKHFFLPFPGSGGDELINGAEVVCPVVIGGSVKIPRRVKNQGTIRKSRIRIALEGIKRLKLPIPVL